jgi:hypothetical protein
MEQKAFEFFTTVDQDITMIGEWKRHKASTSQPAIDFAAHEAIG